MSTAYVSTPPDERASGRQAWQLLWQTSRGLSLGTVAWVVGSAVLPPLVVIALGAVVGAVPDAIRHGMSSTAGSRLTLALIIAALVYATSLILDPIGTALSTAASTRLTADLQHRLMLAVSRPIGVGHLEDSAVLDRVARAEGSLTGYFPGDAPVTWAGLVASRISGLLGCLIVMKFVWWLGPLLLLMWLGVRRLVLGAVVRQATDLRGQTTEMRRAWYLIGVGSKPRDAKEVRVFGLAEFLATRFRTEYRRAIAVGQTGLADLHRKAGLAFLIVLAGYAGALVAVAELARHGRISLTSLAILLPMLAVTMSAGSVSFDDITLTWALAGLPDVDRLEQDLSPTTLSAGIPVPHNHPRQQLKLDQVRFRYPGQDRDVLSGVDLELPAGTSTAIVGVNGAGKSTLVSLLARLRDPAAGSISVDGVDLRNYDPVSWQRNVALMPQEPARFPVSLYDNIAFGAIEHRDDEAGVRAVAAQAGVTDFLDRLVHGWDTVLHRQLTGGTDLSGGQWQRLALARALFATRHGAGLLILDEPTANLDVRAEAQFYRHFFDITHGLTTVVISHRFATVRQADVICVLDGGVITERGTHAELLDRQGSYARMYRVQAARFGGRR